nr:hypothetical protein [Tanacetum cinerariifolium]
MATTIENQVALDEALVPSTQREMLHICPRIPGQAFAELPFEEEILEFIQFLGHGATIRTLTDININKLYQPLRSFAAIINKFLTGKSSGYDSLRLSQAQILDDSIFSTIKVVSRHQNTQQYGAMLPIELTNDEIRNTKAYKEYYTCATGEATPKPKANTDAQEKDIDDDEGDERGESDDGEEDDAEDKDGDERDDDDDDEQEIATIDEQDDTKRGGDDDEESESYEESDSDETREGESFDPIPRTLEDSEDDGNCEEDQGLKISKEERLNEEEGAEELYRDESLSVSSQFVTSMLNPPSDAVAADLSEMELKKILIEKMEGNKSIQRSDEQRNLYKALVDAYEADKTILDSYRDTIILKRRHDDDDDQEEGPFARSDWGSKRRREEEPMQTISQMDEPSYPVFEIGADDQTIVQSSQHPEWFSQLKKPPTSDRDWNKTLPFYGFTVNRESALDVYFKRRIIAVTDLKIVEWHSYKHLDWITIRRDDDKLYRFKEGDFKRMFTRIIVIQRRMEDLQLGVESYQKRLNLTKPYMYRSDLKRREAYTAYSNPRGFIYQNKDKKNRLMRIDELHKFNDGTLNDARNALDDRIKGIRMQYLPQTIWRKGDKDIAAAMIQAIDKMLKTRRIMRSLERFVGGRLYEGDFRMLQRTI